MVAKIRAFSLKSLYLCLMIWLASFPRSGNTFFRNVLYEVYGLTSSAYHHDPNRKLVEDYAEYPVVKTHLLPAQLPKRYANEPSVYIIRDGRDAVISLAHHRKDLIAPGSNFYINLLNVIIAGKGTFFDGWSKNVSAWAERADLCIYFADLIADPIGEIEKLRKIMPLPEASVDKLPTFKQLKFGNPRYGSGDKNKQNKAQKHFRKGKRGGWKEEFPPELLSLFWDYHRETMISHDFTNDMPSPLTNKERREIVSKIMAHIEVQPDAEKLIEHELVHAMPMLLQYGRGNKHPSTTMENRAQSHFGYERMLLTVKDAIKAFLPTAVYNFGKRVYEQSFIRVWLLRVKRAVANRQMRKIKK